MSFPHRILVTIAIGACLCACGGGGDGKQTDNPTKDTPGKETPGKEEKPVEYSITADAGWDIYKAGTYRYGPSIIINDDGSIDAWFAASGSTFASDAGGQLYKEVEETKIPINLSSVEVGLAFTAKEPFHSLEACCPTWSTNGTENMTMSLFIWNSSYSKTVAETPVATREVKAMQDNAWNRIAKEDGTKFDSGRYLLILSKGSSNAGVWYYKEAANAEGMDLQAFQNGSAVTGAPQVILNLESTAGVSGSYWDQISYQHSKDGGKTWTEEEMVLKPTKGTRDELSCCDPGVIKIGEYYYLGYTSTEHTGGLENHLYMARGKFPKGPWEKWNGSGWGGDKVEPIVTYTGAKEKWGVGEPSMVILNGTLYLYYTWDEGGPTTRVATAPADDPLWPSKLNHFGTAVNKQGMTAADHCDVKYFDDMGMFIAVHTANRMSRSSFIQIWTSKDGRTFEKWKTLNGSLGAGLHNIGISGDSRGHIDINKKQFIGYAYGLDENGNSSWGRWNTKWNPLTISKKQ